MDSTRKLLLFGAGWMAFAACGAFGQGTPPSPAVAEWQTAAGGKMAFAVASVKQSSAPFAPPSFPLDEGDAFRPTGGLFHADFPLTVYIQFAYKFRLTAAQMQSLLAHLPKWVATDRFSIQARAEGNPTKDQIRLMMQSLLADRFKLLLHFETQEAPVFVLTLVKAGKLGPKLRPHADGPPCAPPAPQGPYGPAAAASGTDVFPPVCDVYMLISKPTGVRMLGSRNTTMDLLASSVSSDAQVGRPVVDKTGLGGRFDFAIEWTPETGGPAPPDKDVQPDSQGPTFLAALREQLGLKLESTRGPVQVLVIDHIESLSEN